MRIEIPPEKKYIHEMNMPITYGDLRSDKSAPWSEYVVIKLR